VHLYPGGAEQYFSYVKECNDRERHEQQERERALTDPASQCSHGVSLFKGCNACCAEWKTEDGRLWHDAMGGKECGMCGFRK